jgi:hypothetical protein
VQQYAQLYAQQYAQQYTQLLAQQYAAAGLSAAVAASQQQQHPALSGGLPVTPVPGLQPAWSTPSNFCPGTHVYNPTAPHLPKARNVAGGGAKRGATATATLPASSSSATPPASGPTRGPEKSVIDALMSHLAQRTPGTTFHFNVASATPP